MPDQVQVGKNVVEGELINQLIGQVFGNQDNITALAGGGLSSKTPVLKAGACRVATVATGGDSVALPPAIPNPKGVSLSTIIVINDTATSMNVFPQSTDQVNDGGAGAALAQGGNSRALYVCPSKGLWFRILSA
jgi:hypothetical protein